MSNNLQMIMFGSKNSAELGRDFVFIIREEKIVKLIALIVNSF